MKKAAADKPAAPKAQAEAPGFEEALKRLTAIVERLESGDLSLEQSLSLFDAAEKRVEELLAIDAKGLPVVRELDPE